MNVKNCITSSYVLFNFIYNNIFTYQLIKQYASFSSFISTNPIAWATANVVRNVLYIYLRCSDLHPHIHIHTQAHTHTQTLEHTHTYLHTHLHTHTHTHIRLHTPTHILKH